MVGRTRIGIALILMALLSACASSPGTPVAATIEPDARSVSEDDLAPELGHESPKRTDYAREKDTAGAEETLAVHGAGLYELGAKSSTSDAIDGMEKVSKKTSLLDLQTEIVTSYQNFRYDACIAAALALKDRDDAGDREKSEALIMAGAAAYLQGDYFLSRVYFRRANRHAPRQALDARYFPRGMRNFYRETLAGPPE